jgi:hypothetical protein
MQPAPFSEKIIIRVLKKGETGVIASDRRERSNLLPRKKKEIALSLRSSQ